MAAILEQRGTVRAIATALTIKPFIIFAGVSGSGKTQLARRLAAGIAAGAAADGRYSRTLPPEARRGDALAEMIAASGVAPALTQEGDPRAYIEVNPLRKIHGDDPIKVPGLTLPSSYQDIFSNRVAFVPVRPDWRDARDMWGNYNPLTGLFYPTAALRVLMHAFMEFARLGSRAGRHFLILDEMNLARVEYFMSDLLSLMESGAYEDEDGQLHLGELAQVHSFRAPLWTQSPPVLSGSDPTAREHLFRSRMREGWLKTVAILCYGSSNYTFERFDFNINEILDGASWDRLVPPRLAFPPNLTIVGTVNVDETTFALAPKVLDRAFVVEFSHMDFAGVCSDWPGYAAIAGEIETLSAILSAAGQPFGYRVVKEVLDYLNVSGRGWDEEGDFLIASKLLPKIRGTEEELGDGLRHLLAYCLGLPDTDDAHTSVHQALATPFPRTLDVLATRLEHNDVAHPRSAARVLQMVRELHYSGVTSFM